MNLDFRKVDTTVEQVFCILDPNEVRKAVLFYLKYKGHNPKGDVVLNTQHFVLRDEWGQSFGYSSKFTGAEVELVDHHPNGL